MSGSPRLLIVAVVLACAGCPTMSRWGASRDPFGPKAACALPPESTKEEIVAYLNKNVLGADGQAGLRGWKTDSAKVRVSGIPMDATAMLQVAAPRNFRLRVMQPLSNTARLDIGSNSEQFWMWSKDEAERVVLTCRHDQMAATASNLSLPVPFQPDWLMEVLGVIPLDPSEFRMEREGNGSPFVNLIADCHGPTGEPVQRVIQVNACHGLVYTHKLRSASGETIATANFSDHYRDPETKLILVKQIRLELPKDKMFVTIKLDRIQVNPEAPESSVVWSVPHPEGHRMVDLAEVARQRGGPPVADASDEFAAEKTSSQASGKTTTDEQGLDAPTWPPGSPAKRKRPTLSLETESAPGEEPAFTPPGEGFELPGSSPRPEVRPAASTFRGQSPQSDTEKPAPSETGVFARFKSFFKRSSSSADAPPEAYSTEASRSSWGRPRLGQE